MSPTARQRNDGFAERGDQVTRIEAFVDAAFAFAVTLLVISLDKIPDSRATLLLALKRIPAFAASFTLVTMFWHQHHVWSRRYGLNDRRSTLLSLVLVFLVLIYVFPLRVLFTAFFAWISHGFFPTDFRIDSLASLRAIFVVYGTAFGSLGLVVMGLYSHALSQRNSIGLSSYEVLETRRDLAGWALAPITSLLSIVLALAMRESWPGLTFGLPGAVYGGMGLTGVLGRWWARRSLQSEAT